MVIHFTLFTSLVSYQKQAMFWRIIKPNSARSHLGCVVKGMLVHIFTMREIVEEVRGNIDTGLYSIHWAMPLWGKGGQHL